MAVKTGDGSLERALQKAADVSSLLSTANVLVSSPGFGESPKPATSAAKAGISFVIPKNKLSGALVPVMRTVPGKWEPPNDVKREEDPKSVVYKRRTRWGADLTQDPAVQRGRALALQETGSRIAIRGKGAVKEGKKSNASRLQGGRRDAKDAEGAFEDLHVHITADSVEKVDAAVALVEPLLTPVDGKVLDKEYLTFLEELGNGLAGPTALSAPRFATKSGGEDSTRKSSQPGPALTTPRSDSALAGSDTSLDPNQLVDVINKPHPSFMGLNQPQHIPPAPAWPPGNAFTNSCEGKASLQQGVHPQIEGYRPFSGMFQRHPPQYGFNAPSGSFAHTGISHASVPLTYQGRPSPAMTLNMGGLLAPQHFHAGPDGGPTNRSHFFVDNEAGPESLTSPMPHNSGHLRKPSHSQIFNSMPLETSKGLGSQWNHTVSSPPVGIDHAPMVWETNNLPRPPAARWKRGLVSQPDPWQMTREPAMPPHWEVTQKPWEVNPFWNGPSLPTQPWQPTQQRPFHPYHPQPTAPNLGQGACLWRGGPGPQSASMHLPNQSENILPHSFSSQPSQPHMDLFPSWHPLSQSVTESGKFPSTLAASQTSQSGGTFIPPPLPPATTLKVAFTPTTGTQESSKSTMQVPGSTPTGFAALTKNGWVQQGSEILRPPWPSSPSTGKNSKPAPTTPVTGSPHDVDPEYEKLMASVGVT